MASKKEHCNPEPFDFDRFQSDLCSPVAETRARAARQICPCRLGWEVFERCMALVEPLRKDPSPMVRRAALHVFEDAFEMESRGLPTTPQEVKNEMVARRRASRWGDEREKDAPDAVSRDRNGSGASHGRGGWRARQRGVAR
jgi:hypothetical protein